MSDILTETIAAVSPLDDAAMHRAQRRQEDLTKPVGSLGRLESIAVQLAGIAGRDRPRLGRATVVVMAADHGVTEEGISAYPSSVTVEMIRNFLAGGAAINAIARTVNAQVVVVDMGTFEPVVSEDANFIRRRVGPGTANLARQPAMTAAQALASIEAGIKIAAALQLRRADVVCAGEMGIGNTTAASAIIAAACGLPPRTVAGRGTGIDAESFERKVRVIEASLRLNRPEPSDPVDVLAKVGGFEIGGLTGLILGAASLRVAVIVDGLISAAAALLAVRLCPTAADYLLAGHRSTEPGHAIALDALRLEPLLSLDMRLGEGSGAALAIPIIRAAARTLAAMSTFEEAAVSRSRGP